MFLQNVEDKILYKHVNYRSKSRENAKWRKKDRILQHAEHLQLSSDQREVCTLIIKTIDIATISVIIDFT